MKASNREVWKCQVNRLEVKHTIFLLNIKHNVIAN